MTQHRFAALLAAAVMIVFPAGALAGGNGGGNGNSANAPGHQQQQPAAQPQPAASPATQPAAPPAAAPAQKSTPPGQAKKQAPASAPAPAAQAPATQTQSAPATKHANKPAHGAASKQSSTSASNPATGGSNAQGVKPSNTTKHDTYAKASSNQTKKYGNGKTAGQIATQAGYGNATLHGPGNSQPHKTAPCPGSKHEVDVHALKNKSAKCGTAEAAKPEVKQVEVKKEEKHEVEQQAATQAPCAPTTQTVTEQRLVGVKHMIGPKGSGRFVIIHPSTHSAHFTGKHPDDVPIFETVTKTLTASNAASCASVQTQATQSSQAQVTQSSQAQTQVSSSSTQQGVAAAQATKKKAAAPAVVTKPATKHTAKPAGGVKGARIALHPAKKPAHGGVLGTTTRLGSTVASSHLPFTGLPLWIFGLAALALIAAGLLLRRSSADRV